MTAPSWQELVDLLGLVRDDLAAKSAGKSWEWDGRFASAVCVIDKDAMATVRGLLSEHLPDCRDMSTIKGAHERVQKLVGSAGGLRSGQLVFCSDPSTPEFAFCSWWPWGGGARVSLRFGIAGATDVAAVQAALRATFGIS